MKVLTLVSIALIAIGGTSAAPAQLFTRTLKEGDQCKQADTACPPAMDGYLACASGKMVKMACTPPMKCGYVMQHPSLPKMATCVLDGGKNGDNGDNGKNGDAGKGKDADAGQGKGKDADAGQGKGKDADAGKYNGDDAGKYDGDDAGKYDGDDAGKYDGDDAGKYDGDDAGKYDGDDAGKYDGDAGKYGDAGEGKGKDADAGEGKGKDADAGEGKGKDANADKGKGKDADADKGKNADAGVPKSGKLGEVRQRSATDTPLTLDPNTTIGQAAIKCGQEYPAGLALSEIRKKNGADAKCMQDEFDSKSVKEADACNNNDSSCINGQFCKCSGGAWQCQQAAAGTECVVLPLRNAAGISMTLATRDEQKTRVDQALQGI